MQTPPLHYPPPPPPPRKGLSGVVIALIVVGGLGALSLVGLFVAGVVIGFQRQVALSKAAKADPKAAALVERYTTTNGLLTAHYPSDFAAKAVDNVTLVVSRNLGSGDDEALTLAAIANPVTDDPHELARILWNAHDKAVTGKGGTSQRTADRKAKCLGKYDGVAWEGTWDVSPGSAYQSKGCFFVTGGRGYELRYDVSRARAAEEAALLDRIVDATELAP